MKRLINFLSKINTENNFMNLYYVGISLVEQKKPTNTIESIMFYERKEAEKMRDYLNEKYNTTIYRVYKTCIHIH